MRRWALIQNGIVSRIVEATNHPFHASQTVVDVTAVPAQVGYRADAYGNVSASLPGSVADATQAKRDMLRSETEHQMLRGVWMDGPDGKVLFDTSPENIALLTALDKGSAEYTPAADGSLPKVSASKVFSAAAALMAKCFAHEAEVADKLKDDPETDITDGWPDNGEPDAADKADTAPPVTPAMVAPQAPAAEASPTPLPAATPVALPEKRADGSAVGTPVLHSLDGKAGKAATD